MSPATVSRRTALVPLSLLAAFALSVAPAASAAPQLIAERPAEIGPFDGAIDQLDAEGGVVAWQETRLAVPPGTEAAFRTTVLVGGRKHRTPWRRHRQWVDVGAAHDASGTVRIRVMTTDCDARGRCAGPGVIRSPWTLRPVDEAWVEARETRAARQETTVVARTFADDGAGVVRGDDSSAYPERPSHCTYRLLGQGAKAVLPTIGDCLANWAFAGGPLVVTSFTRPSEQVAEADGKNSGLRTRVFMAADRTVPAPSWFALGTYSEGRGTTDGVQALCVQGDRVVVLGGLTDVTTDDGGRPTVRLVAVRPADGTRRAVATPELGLDASGDMPPVQLACTDRWVYAAYGRSWPGTKRSPVARVVRYRMPG